MDNEPENQDWRKFGEGGKNRWKKDEKNVEKDEEYATIRSHDKTVIQ